MKKNKVNPVYGIPFASDDTIWDKNDRLTLLSYDPIYQLARQPDSIGRITLNRGSFVRLSIDADKCERIAGLRTYTNNGKKFTIWPSIPN